MTLTTSTIQDSYVGNGTQLLYKFSFQLQKESDLEVALDGVVQTYGSDYSVRMMSVGGMVFFGTAPAANTQITLRRTTRPLTHTLSIITYDSIGNRLEAVELALDRFTMALQERTLTDLSARARATSFGTAELTVEAGVNVTIDLAATSAAGTAATSYISLDVALAATSAGSARASADLTAPTVTLAGAPAGACTVTAELDISGVVDLAATSLGVSLATSALTTPPGESTLINTLTVTDGGSGSTTPWVVCGVPVQKGVLDTASQVIEVRKADGSTVVTSQQDLESTAHSDGTLSNTAVMFQADTLGAGASDDYLVYAVPGSKPAPELAFLGEDEDASKDRVIAENLFIKNNINGTDYFLRVNDLIDTATMIKSGPLCRQWEMAGEMSGPGNHPKAWGRIWVTIWNDGSTIDIFGQVINGYVQASYSADLTSSISLWNGGSQLIGGGSWNNIPHHAQSNISVCEQHGKPYFLSNEPDIEVNYDTALLQNTYAFMPYVIATPAAPTIPSDYTPWMFGEYRSYFGASGGHPQIGPMCEWTSRALLAQTPAWNRADRVQALASGRIPVHWYEQATKQVPVLTDVDYSGDGMGSVDRQTMWLAGDSSPAGAGYSALDPTHFPEIYSYQAATSGQPWFADMLLATATHFFGAQQPGYGRNTITVNGRTFTNVINERGQWQARGVAWQMRQWSNAAWFLPDVHPAKNYVVDTVKEQFDYMDWRFKYTEAQGGEKDGLRNLGVWNVLVGINPTLDASDVMANFMQDFMAWTICTGYLRGYVASTLVTNIVNTGNLGRAANGSFYVCHATRHRFGVRGNPTTFYPDWASCTAGRAHRDGNFTTHVSNDPADHPLTGLHTQPPPRGTATSDSASFFRWQSSTTSTSGYAMVLYGVANLAKYVNFEAGTTVCSYADAVANYLADENPGVYEYATHPKLGCRFPRTT